MSQVWHQLLRSTDRLTSIDPERFLDPEVTSREYGLRYAEDVAYDEQELLVAMGFERAGDIEDVLSSEEEYNGNEVVDKGGIELIDGRVGTRLTTPSGWPSSGISPPSSLSTSSVRPLLDPHPVSWTLGTPTTAKPTLDGSSCRDN